MCTLLNLYIQLYLFTLHLTNIPPRFSTNCKMLYITHLLAIKVSITQE